MAQVLAERNRRGMLDAAATLRDVGECLIELARAIEEDDEILGSLAGMGLANHLPALPKHIRDVLMEHLDDEAARGARADELYWKAMA